MDFIHNGPPQLRLGVLFVQNVCPTAKSEVLEAGLLNRLNSLESGLSEKEDAFRAGVRDVFRNGSYKPTGRAKPASEYLLRAASESRFPRINTLVDTCNFLSVSCLLPISIWDTDKAESDVVEFRLGMEKEEYVFNQADQRIQLKDLIVGCVVENDRSRPIINAVKDSMSTKTSDSTSNVAAVIYAPETEGPLMELQEACTLFVRILSETHPDAAGQWAILSSGDSVQF